MRRSQQIKRIRRLERELGRAMTRVESSSRRPMEVIRRYGGWLLPASGLIMGAMLARVSAHNVVARGISVVMLLVRAQRLMFRWVQRA